ncbi:hypothetical protein PanWU01x14_197080 [Parasponia andersonii]|uniref:Uncharacterized protein n=1 Tax=Parasponia andersonii TaxID=3476 RepID=A0A2P5BZH4_PARAD|nr:hypothetical protein PanWU01x14_197080 [Parasponia andersonii]
MDNYLLANFLSWVLTELRREKSKTKNPPKSKSQRSQNHRPPVAVDVESPVSIVAAVWLPKNLHLHLGFFRVYLCAGF